MQNPFIKIASNRRMAAEFIFPTESSQPPIYGVKVDETLDCIRFDSAIFSLHYYPKYLQLP